MTDRELMQEAWETLNIVMAPFPVDDQRCLRVARMLEKRLKQLEVQSTHSDDCWRWHHECAIAKIERLAQPKQEPVAWLYRDSWGTMKLSQVTPPPVGAFPVYTATPQPAPPPECQTEEEKTAFAFGWMKAMEAQRLAQPEQDPKPEPALSKKHLRIGDLWRKHDGK